MGNRKLCLKTALTAIICISMVMLMSTIALAHGTLSEFHPNPGANEGVIRFFFDDDEFMSHVEVTVYDTSGVQIAVSETDARGLFDFSGFENVGHVIARYDAEHIQIHVVAEGGGYIVGQNFGGTYVSHNNLGTLLRNFVLARWWLGIYVLVIPAVIFAASLVFFIVTRRTKKYRDVRN